ncbi:MAG: hypothetical protein ACP5F9_11020, partial [Thiomonas sp.]
RAAAVVLIGSLLLAGCDDPSKVQLEKQVQDQQQQIADLTSKLNAAISGEQKEIAQAQTMVNLAFAYEWSGPAQILPVWNTEAVEQGRMLMKTPPKQQKGKDTLITPSFQPDWAGYGLLTVIWAGMIAVLGAFAAAFWVVAQRLQRLQQLRRIEAEIMSKRSERQRLASIHHELEDARRALEDALAREKEAQAKTEALQAKIAELKQRKASLQQEIEREKAKVLEAFRHQIQEQHARSQQIAKDIDKGLEDL